MDIIVSKVYDKLRFAHFINIKYEYSFTYANVIIDSINKHGPIKFYNLKECEVRYLQSMKYECSYDKPQICKLKIVNGSISIKTMKENETKSCIDISPQPDDEPKQESLDLFHVKFTKVVHYDEMLNERQIQALLKDNHVKSINIEK